MSDKKKTRSYPEPFVVDSLADHKHSFILLHGRGSNGEHFGTELLNSRMTLDSESIIEDGQAANTLRQYFPNAKFIFPTAKKRRAKWYNRATINQWFDSVPIDEQDHLIAGMTKEQEEWQLEGLRESRAFIKNILDAEIELVGTSNVVIGGLSQGCAMSLHVLLSLDSDDIDTSSQLAGFVGMSGWLPYADTIADVLNRGQTSVDESAADLDEDGDDDPFATSDDDAGSEDDIWGREHERKEPQTSVVKVCGLIRDNMDLPQPAQGSKLPWTRTPIFLGHGKSDEKVKMAKGAKAAECLQSLGLQVTWREYDEGHWYKVPDEIDDIARFLRACLATR
ncbi:hypothetical protein CB0940_06104 [Cercospora beticola]|uniref:Phospholipase/carboxylesterase/thioesterase domain-containing protein n=1 Tax=Cercospora beticola TaxID=122368 RepID=A0A2G5HZA6_CERBT|nr:hypothetical protein CB0940_06104 [Cercospora beticola]PIA97879.1 hypothetical protein CB0940_06104 [Cercospora beticola]WPA98718.1 hypothetical protein RHO25_003331 [Cercospora beticola]CAK1359989.1 unnamed protein product [Cercospora beticola]